MCQLLVLSFNVPVRPEISSRGSMRRGRSNPHGWGLALYPVGKAAQVVMEPVVAAAAALEKLRRMRPGK
jgi:predicted glutamine amidotransferase